MDGWTISDGVLMGEAHGTCGYAIRYLPSIARRAGFREEMHHAHDGSGRRDVYNLRYNVLHFLYSGNTG